MCVIATLVLNGQFNDGTPDGCGAKITNHLRPKGRGVVFSKSLRPVGFGFCPKPKYKIVILLTGDRSHILSPVAGSSFFQRAACSRRDASLKQSCCGLGLSC